MFEAPVANYIPLIVFAVLVVGVFIGAIILMRKIGKEEIRARKKGE